MSKSIFPAVVLILPAVCSGEVQIPPGFEVVQITDDPENDRNPRINNCGEIVFFKHIPEVADAGDIFLYENGRVTRLTDDDVPDAHPDINDAGTVAWTRFPGEYYEGHIFMRLADGETTWLGLGSGTSINNLDHVAWKLLDATECAAPSDIFFYNGETVERITDDGLSNQDVEINDFDELVWTRFDVCEYPGVADVMLHSDGVTTALTDGEWHYGPTINNQGQIAWTFDPVGAEDGLEFWEDGETVVLSDWGMDPHVNESGGIAFIRWYEDNRTYQIWLYRDGVFVQITDNSVWNDAGGINDAGEIVWSAGIVPEMDIFFLRRIRDGDVDFDGGVDLDDFAALHGCMTGPLETDRFCECRFFDLDHDRDVDLEDFAAFQRVFGGEQ